MTEGELSLPQPEAIPARERDDALGAYLMMFASLAAGLPLPFITLIASVVYYLINRRSSTFVAFHALQALIAHVPVALGNAAAVVWTIVLLVGRHWASTGFWVYLLALLVLNLLYFIYSVIAMVRAGKGRFYYIPLVGRLAFDRCYGAAADARRLRREERRQAREDSGNRPPPGIGRQP